MIIVGAAGHRVSMSRRFTGWPTTAFNVLLQLDDDPPAPQATFNAEESAPHSSESHSRFRAFRKSCRVAYFRKSVRSQLVSAPPR